MGCGLIVEHKAGSVLRELGIASGDFDLRLNIGFFDKKTKGLHS